MKNLEDIYTELGFDPSHYARWSKTILKDCREGQHYTVETNNFGKKLYKVTDIAIIVILERYLHATPSITEELLFDIAATSELPYLKAMSKLSVKHFNYFMNQVKRAFNASLQDIPEHFIMPSQAKIKYETLRNFGLIDEEGIIIENSDNLFPRLIIKANGEIDYHVILHQELAEETLLRLEYEKQAKLEDKRAQADTWEPAKVEDTRKSAKSRKADEVPYDL